MKKLLLTLALVAATAAVYAQGTINFPNTALTRVQLDGVNVPVTANLINYGVFWGTAADNLSLVPTLGANSTVSAGLIGGAANANFLVTGSQANQVVYLQIRGWSASFGSDWFGASKAPGVAFGQTDVRQVTLGPTAGPGSVIWQTASGTAADRFTPLKLVTNPVPEPTSFALVGLGAAALLIFRRR